MTYHYDYDYLQYDDYDYFQYGDYDYLQYGDYNYLQYDDYDYLQYEYLKDYLAMNRSKAAGVCESLIE